MSNLFSTFRLGDIQLKNRVVMAPLTRSRAINNIPNDLMATYYGQRSGAGLIITEGTSPSPNGLGYPRIPGVFSEEQLAGWKKITTAVHDNGGKIFLQLMHTGRVAHPDNLPDGASVLAPSELAAPEQMYTDENGMQDFPVPHGMSINEISAAIGEYVTAAKNAISAGFDGVEIHAANGYLIEQFINPLTNQRKDKYGGSVERRLRFALEVTEKIVEAIGDKKVGMRISPYGVFNGTGAFDSIEETYQFLVRQISGMGVQYIHVVDHSSMGTPEVPDSIKKIIRDNFSGAYILSGGYDKARAEKDLQDNKGDLVSFGRPFISNPDLVERMQQDAKLAEPNADLFYTPGAEGYTDYPSL